MARVHINLEDHPDGHISCVVDYVRGFDLQSHAHQTANLVIKHLDEILKQVGKPTFEQTLDAPSEAGFALHDVTGAKPIHVAS